MYIHDHSDKITAVKLSKILNCTTRTIHRNIGKELKQEKDLLNKQL
jgi:transcriptional antiterminator